MVTRNVVDQMSSYSGNCVTSRECFKAHAAWCVVLFEKTCDGWVQNNPFANHPIFEDYFGEVLYVPDTITSGRRVVMETDYTHKVSRLRKFVCTDAVPGVKVDGWRAVARSKDSRGKPVTNLTELIVEASGGDQMKLTFTRTFFSSMVAEELKKQGFENESKFCSAVYHYLQAHDDRGIRAEDRIKLMMPLYNILRGMIVIPRFPVYTRNTENGMNFHFIEEVLCGIQARACLYLMTPETGYAARAFSSIDVKNVHGFINYLDKRGVQTSSIAEVAGQISHLQVVQILRKKSTIGREMYNPSSTIYERTEVGDDLAERLTSSSFDCNKGSSASKEVRPYDRHDPARGHLSIRSVGRYRYRESSFMKR